MVKKLTYTAKRNEYYQVMIGMTAVILLEAGLIGTTILIVLPAGIVRLMILVILGAVLVFAGSRLIAPLLTAHTLTDAGLRLRYGFGLNTELALDMIAVAAPTKERVDGLRATRARYDHKHRRVLAAFSDEGQVILKLGQPCLIKVGIFGGGPTDEILINLDDRDALLSAIDLEPKQHVSASDKLVPKVRGRTRMKAPSVNKQADAALWMEGLTRKFGEITAVDNLTLQVAPGEIYGFLGANGAGKSTTIKMITGLLEPTTGHIWVNKFDVWSDPVHAKSSLGYVADGNLVYERLTGREFLQFLRQLRGLSLDEAEERIERLLVLLDLEERADELVLIYSFGMKRKLAVAGAILHQPRVMVMDEPFNGLDPISARRLKSFLVEIAQAGTAIFLSTHDLATAEALCNRVGIIHKGKLMAEGSVSELKELESAPDL